MLTIEEKLQQLEKIILKFEKAYKESTLSRQLLTSYQVKVDELEKRLRADANLERQLNFRLYELQSLIDLAKGEIGRAKQFALEARQIYPSGTFLTKVVQELNTNISSNLNRSDSVVEFYYIRPRRLVPLSILTFGFYLFWWNYKNWLAQAPFEPKRASAFWRAFFAPFWVWPLFKTILVKAKEGGYPTSYTPGWQALLYFMLNVIGLSFIPLLIVQKAMKYHNLKYDPNYKLEKKLSLGEAVVIIIGILLLIVNFSAGYSDNYSSTSDAYITAVREEYDSCISALEAARPSVDTTSQVAVDSFNTEHDRCEMLRNRYNDLID